MPAEMYTMSYLLNSLEYFSMSVSLNNDSFLQLIFGPNMIIVNTIK